MWAAGSKLLESLAVRVPFVLFVLLLAPACARAGGAVQGDGGFDRPIATAADVAGVQAAFQCAVDAAVNLNPSSAVDILIMLDGSESMSTGFGSGTRYGVVAGVLSDLVDAYQSRIRFGFATFPGEDTSCPSQTVTGCCAGPPSVGVAPNNGVAVQGALQSAPSLTGNTPTALALQRARKYYADLADRFADRYVLLATDGLPDCTLSGALSASQPVNADGGLTSACLDAITQMQALVKDGVKVVVLGVGAELNDDPAGPPECLTQMAQAGPMQYYSAASPENLKLALETIFGGATRTSCLLELDPPPSSPDSVSVYLDEQEIPQNPDNGWGFDGDTQHIRIIGEYCVRIQHFRYSTIEARYGCKPCSEPGNCPR